MSHKLAPFGMTMRFLEGLVSRFRLFALVVLCATVGACDNPSRPGPGGFIFFGSGSYLGKFSLGDGSSEVAAYVGDGTVTSVSNYKDGELLLTVRRLVNSRDVQMVVRFDIATKHYTNLFVGNSAVFLRDGEITVFDDGFKLQATRIVDNDRRLTNIYPHDFDEIITITPVSDHALFFQVAKNNDSRVFRYDAASETLEPLDEFSKLCDLEGAVWVSESQQMLCHSPGRFRTESEYRFVAPDGRLGAVMPRPGESEIRPVLYLPEQHLLVITEAWQGIFGGRRKFAVWIHDLASGERYRLVKNQYLGDHVAYMPLH
ncbi:MAG: hypothetical protein MUP90_17985 [Gammaproteobacteria bacterium]|nr:hypothetical protein [Gammaproteobacteria bacterium]